MGPGILLMLPLTKKYGRTKAIWTTAVLTIAGSILAFLSVGKGTMIYAGTALAAIGNISFSYMLMTFIEYIPADELERREIARQAVEAEEIRIKELKEKCAKKGLDFEKENQKVLDQRAAAAAKKAAKAAKKAKK